MMKATRWNAVLFAILSTATAAVLSHAQDPPSGHIPTGIISLLLFEENHNVQSATLPTFSSLSLYSSNSPFNTKIGPNPEIDPNSTKLIGSLLDGGDFVIEVTQYSAAIYFANQNTPRHDVTLPCGPYWELGVSVMKNVPIPDWAQPSNDAEGTNPPVGCGEESDQDNHMIIMDLGTRCEYDFWQARKVSGKWIASWGNSISLDSSGVYEKALSTRGSGFAFPGGLIWPDELKNGEIKHTLVFSYPFPKAGGPVAPATDSDGISTRSDAIPEGALLQLNPDLDLDSLSLAAYEKTIAKALQEYGMLLVDRGGDDGIAVQAVNPISVTSNPYDGILPDLLYPPLTNIPLTQFRVLKMGAQNPNYEEDQEVVESGCAVIE